MNSFPETPELPASVRVADSSDVLEIIFEHCGLLFLDTLQLVCRNWHDLARMMPALWATATIDGQLGNPMYAWSGVRLPQDGRLAVTNGRLGSVHFFSFNKSEAYAFRPTTPSATQYRSLTGLSYKLGTPRGLATDGMHLYVADCGFHRVTQLRFSDGAIVGSIGKYGPGDGQLALPAGLALVRGGGAGAPSIARPSDSALTASTEYRLFVADCNNHRICVFGVSPLRFLTSIGQRGSAPRHFNFPEGLAVHAGCMYVADPGNSRVQVNARMINRA